MRVTQATSRNVVRNSEAKDQRNNCAIESPLEQGGVGAMIALRIIVAGVVRREESAIYWRSRFLPPGNRRVIGGAGVATPLS